MDWRDFGVSLTLEQGLLILLTGLVIRNHGKINGLEARLKEHIRKHK